MDNHNLDGRIQGSSRRLALLVGGAHLGAIGQSEAVVVRESGALLRVCLAVTGSQHPVQQSRLERGDPLFGYP